MIEKPNSPKEQPNLKKPSFFKHRRFNYVVFPTLIIMFFGLTVAFQNCESINGQISNQKAITNNQDAVVSVSPIPSTTTASPTASKAVFNITEQQGNTISNILWQVKNNPCHGESEVIATGTNSNLEIDWKSSTDVSVEVFVQFEGQSCIHYKQYKPWEPGVMCTQVYTFEDFKRDHNPWEILAISSDDETIVGNEFPVGSVDIEFAGEDDLWEGELNPLNSLDFTSFQWSIQNAKDQVELADSSNETEGLTYNFSEVGVYNVSVIADLPDEATETGGSSEDPYEQELYNEIQAEGGITRHSKFIIGKCEEDTVDIEVSLK